MGFADRFSLEGKTAFVTGASYGLGVGFAKALADAGPKRMLHQARQFTDRVDPKEGLPGVMPVRNPDQLGRDGGRRIHALCSYLPSERAPDVRPIRQQPTPPHPFVRPL